MKRVGCILFLAMVLWTSDPAKVPAQTEPSGDPGCASSGPCCVESMAGMTTAAILELGGNEATAPGPASPRIAADIPVIGGSGQRPVVIEQFTAAWCPYCYGSGRALDRLQFQLAPRDDVIVISYHIFNDGYTTVIGESRKNYYGIGSVPRCLFNGIYLNTTNSVLSEGETGINRVVESYAYSTVAEQTRTAGTQPFVLRLEGTIGPRDPQFILSISTASGYPYPVTAHFIITEDHIPVNASNGQTELNALARGTLGSETFSMTTPGEKTIVKTYNGLIPSRNAENLRPVVFLQNTATREIVGATGLFWTPPPTPEPLTAAHANWMAYE